MSAHPIAKHPRTLSLALALGLATLLLYSPVLGFDFISYDDPGYVVHNTHVSRGLTWDNILWALTAYEVSNWHPLTLISHMTDVSLFGMRAGAHHAVNALLHAINAALLFLFLDAATGRCAPSLAAAGLFAVHPLNVESVAWISQRKSVLCMLFLLLTLLAYVVWARRGGATRYVLAIVAYAAALASKPIAVVLPALLVLVDFWPLGRFPLAVGARFRGTARLLLAKAPFAALAAGASVATWAAQKEGGALWSFQDSTLAERAGDTVFALAWYVVRMIWPSELSLFYPTTLGSAATVRVVGCAALLIVVTTLVVQRVRTRRYLAMGWAWYVLALLPVVGLVRFGTQIVADRYAYLALIGPFAALAFLAADLVAERGTGVRRTAVAATGVVIVALALATGHALSAWRDSLSVFRRGVERAPDNVHALANLGLELVEHERFDEGILLLTRAARMVPKYGTVHVNLGYAYAKSGRAAEARAEYETALSLQPGDAKLEMELGRVLTQLNHFEDAEARFRDAVRHDPELGNGWLFLGALLHTEGRFADAEPCLERAAGLLPDDARSLTAWGVNLAALSRRDEAIATLRKAVQIDPAFTRARTELERIEAAK
jgi:tetratricopeptide (TPR) repeat protein